MHRSHGLLQLCVQIEITYAKYPASRHPALFMLSGLYDPFFPRFVESPSPDKMGAEKTDAGLFPDADAPGRMGLAVKRFIPARLFRRFFTSSSPAGSRIVTPSAGGPSGGFLKRRKGIVKLRAAAMAYLSTVI